ncbi:unnamed protein product [Linum tenue]|uniref:Uncharacterized protein n=1 Tax=Linum tenue TaxID=586396 RepID=A0AAV0Q3U2_9ROSI|nr:unnamed protein product [Linum tenue]
MRNGSYQRAAAAAISRGVSPQGPAAVLPLVLVQRLRPPLTQTSLPSSEKGGVRRRQSEGNAPTWRKNRRPDFTSCAAASPCSSVGTNTPPIPDPHHQLMHRVPTRLID